MENNSRVKSIKRQLISSHDWMVESSGADMKETISGCKKPYEVVVIIHFTNGDSVRLNNECVKSSIMGIYCGAMIEEDIEDAFTISFFDDHGALRQDAFDASSVSWIESYSYDVKDAVIDDIMTMYKAESLPYQIRRAKHKKS